MGATARENIIAVFTRIGGTAEMAKWAKDNLTEFYKLYARLVPVDVRLEGNLNYNANPIPVEQRDPLPMTEQPGVSKLN